MNPEPLVLTRRYRLDPADLPLALFAPALLGLFYGIAAGALLPMWLGSVYLTAIAIVFWKGLAPISSEEAALIRRAAALPEREFHALEREARGRFAWEQRLWAGGAMAPAIALAATLPDAALSNGAVMGALMLTTWLGVLLAGPPLRRAGQVRDVVDKARDLRKGGSGQPVTQRSPA